MYGTVLLVERKVRYGKEIWVVQLLPAMYLFQHFNLWFVAIVETGELVDADAAGDDRPGVNFINIVMSSFYEQN